MCRLLSQEKLRCPGLRDLLAKRLQYEADFDCPKVGNHPNSRYFAPAGK
jgi:hypothetical protein